MISRVGKFLFALFPSELAREKRLGCFYFPQWGKYREVAMGLPLTTEQENGDEQIPYFQVRLADHGERVGNHDRHESEARYYLSIVALDEGDENPTAARFAQENHFDRRSNELEIVVTPGSNWEGKIIAALKSLGVVFENPDKF